jgi:hypothetical protein
MNQEQRPGGLTALAVINFVFAGWGMIGLLFLAGFFAIIGMIPTDQMDDTQRMQIEAFQNMGLPIFIFIFILSLVSNVLLLLSGIGYLKQKKVMGWGLGNAYGIISIISSVASAFLFPREIGGGFNIMAIVGLIYPALTLILLNTTFKDDLTN